MEKLTDAVNGMNTNIKLTIQQLENTNKSLEIVTAQNKKQDDRLTALEKETAVEVKDVTLTAGSDPWPYCVKDTAVGLSTTRKNTAYDVDVYVKSYSGGRLGDITVKDKLANGFKLHHDGSAKTVVVTIKVSGGTK